MSWIDSILGVVGPRGLRWSRAYEHQYKQMPSEWRNKLRSLGIVARLDDEGAIRSDVVADEVGLPDEDALLRVVSDPAHLMEEEGLPVDYSNDEGAFGSIEHHPALACLPRGVDLTDSVRGHGLLEPIVLDGASRLVDGRARLEACLSTNTPIRWVSLCDIAPGVEATLYVVMANMGPRRLMTAKEKAVAIARMAHESKVNIVRASRAAEVNRMYVEYALAILRSEEDDLVGGLHGPQPLYKMYNALRARLRARQERAWLWWIEHHDLDVARLPQHGSPPNTPLSLIHI